MHHKLTIDVCCNDPQAKAALLDGEGFSYNFPLTGSMVGAAYDEDKLTIGFIEETTHRLIYIVLNIRGLHEKIADKLP